MGNLRMPLDTVNRFCWVAHSLNLTYLRTGKMSETLRQNGNLICMGSPDSSPGPKSPKNIVFFKHFYLNLCIPAFTPCMNVTPIFQGNCLMPEADPKNRKINFTDVIET